MKKSFERNDRSKSFTFSTFSFCIFFNSFFLKFGIKKDIEKLFSTPIKCSHLLLNFGSEHTNKTNFSACHFALSNLISIREQHKCGCIVRNKTGSKLVLFTYFLQTKLQFLVKSRTIFTILLYIQPRKYVKVKAIFKKYSTFYRGIVEILRYKALHTYL